MKPLAIDLYAGLGGRADFIARTLLYPDPQLPPSDSEAESTLIYGGEMGNPGDKLMFSARLIFPNSLLVFGSLGILCSLSFALILVLSALGIIHTIHPFLALLGFVGGVGWVATALTDLLFLLKAGKLWHPTTILIDANKSSEHQKTLPTDRDLHPADT